MRPLMFVLVLVMLVASGFEFVRRQQAPPAAAMDHGAGKLAAIELKTAGDQLYLTKHWAGTYNGPDLKNFEDLQLYRADESGFCIQVVKDAQVFRLVGPGGVPEPGHC